MTTRRVIYGFVAANRDTVKTIDTSRTVDHMVVEIDALGLAHIGTPAAIGA